jgi:beta-lactam-binding protein with PASTA domain
MTDFMCFGCMENKGYDHVCPHCGYINGSGELPFSLKEDKILKGRFIVGKVLKKGRNYITYLGYDYAFLQKILIVEYFPENEALRDSKYTSEVTVKENRQELYAQKRKIFLEEGVLLTKQAGLSNMESAYQVFEENKTAYLIMEYTEKNFAYEPLSQFKVSFWERIPKKAKKVGILAASILFVVSVLILFPKPVKMPDVAGLNIDKAAEILNKARIPYETNLVFSTDDSPGEILLQEIPAGTVLKKSDFPVKLTVNHAVYVPNVTGRPIEEAVSTLERYGLNYIAKESYNAAYKPNIISMQNPATGNHPVKEDFTVEIYNNKEVYMPDVTGLQFADAEDVLKEFNIAYKLDYIYLQDNPGNKVLEQTPAPGEPVLNSDESVVLKVNTAAFLPNLTTNDEEEVKNILHYNGYRRYSIIRIHTYEGLPGEFMYVGYEPGQPVSTGTMLQIYQITDGELYFPDSVLFDTVKKVAGKAEMTAIWALGVEAISHDGSEGGKIRDLDGIQYFKNMNTLSLPHNEIMIIDSLMYTTGIKHLDLSWNKVRFINYHVNIDYYTVYVNVLSFMKRLETLNLAYNLITDLDGFEALTSLETLILDGNQIKDITPLTGCTQLKRLSLVNVPVNREDILYLVYRLPQLVELEIDGDGDFDDFDLIK